MFRRSAISFFLFCATAFAFAEDVSRFELVRGEVAGGSLSPDGRLVLVVRGNNALTLYNLSSKKESKVLAGQSIMDPRLDSASKRIIFYGGPDSANPKFEGLWIVNVDGTGKRPFLAKVVPGAEDRSPLWSPDGGRVAWSRSGQIWSAKSDGTQARALSSWNKESYGFPLDWMGNRILIAKKPDNLSMYRIFLLDQDTGELFPTGLESTWAQFLGSVERLVYGNGPLQLWNVAKGSEEPAPIPVDRSFPGTCLITRSADSSRLLLDTMDPEDTSIDHLYLLDFKR